MKSALNAPKDNPSPMAGQDAFTAHSPGASFPSTRLRRLRSAGWIREMVAEHDVRPAHLVMPVFVTEGTNQRVDIASMPGIARLSIDLACEEIKKAADLGLTAFALFPVLPIEHKTLDGREAINPGNLMCRALQAIKKSVPGIGIITDVALDPYTTHGHDGLLEKEKIINDQTVEILCSQALLQAQAGSDVIAPSDMMDGRVGAIRRTLEKNGLTDTIILSYAVKYASAFYGPFRDAVGTKGLLKGDKKTYQMNPTNSDEALREVALDLAEGADMVMIKPGLPYLDVIRRVKDSFRVPTFAYHVSGEYAMLKAAAAQGWLDYDLTLAETLLSFRRAGCDGIITYGAADFVRKILKP